MNSFDYSENMDHLIVQENGEVFAKGYLSFVPNCIAKTKLNYSVTPSIIVGPDGESNNAFCIDDDFAPLYFLNDQGEFIKKEGKKSFLGKRKDIYLICNCGKEEPKFLKIRFWREEAERFVKIAKKGDRIQLVGKVKNEYDSYAKKFARVCDVKTFSVLSKKKGDDLISDSNKKKTAFVVNQTEQKEKIVQEEIPIMVEKNEKKEAPSTINEIVTQKKEKKVETKKKNCFGLYAGTRSERRR